VAAKIREDAPDVADRVTVVAPEESFDVGLPVRAVGELHAVIHPEFPRFFNSGYVLTLGDTKVYHPGDALTPPGEDVEVLCVPVSAPWMRASEAIDFARAVRAPRNLAIHDRVYSEAGLKIVDGHMNAFLPKAGQEYVRLPDGEDL
jgi:L-ascorbate metabolism protein UlaG (beta-lactamase superfamily)